jgi:peptide-methionine (S)-S-oxide reductase
MWEPNIASAIFPANQEQARIAGANTAQLSQARMFPAGIATRIEPGRDFYPAEAYHQDYLTRNPADRYIAVNDLPKIEDLKLLFPELYRAAPVLVAASQPSN